MADPTLHSSKAGAAATAGISDREFSMQGWALLGSLKSGWNADIQANYNDMTTKLKQLQLFSLLPSSESEPVLNPDYFFYSQGSYDFLQLLATDSNTVGELDDYKIVAYSIWMSAQGWGGFSPFPLISYNKGSRPETYYLYPVDQQEYDTESTHITGWCVIGSFGTEWYKSLKKNYHAAYHKRRALGLSEATPLYWAQRQDIQCLQVLQAPVRPDPDPGSSISNNYSALTEYINWFGDRGFGTLTPQPFMSGNMAATANTLAGQTP